MSSKEKSIKQPQLFHTFLSFNLFHLSFSSCQRFYPEWLFLVLPPENQNFLPHDDPQTYPDKSVSLFFFFIKFHASTRICMLNWIALNGRIPSMQGSTNSIHIKYCWTANDGNILTFFKEFTVSSILLMSCTHQNQFHLILRKWAQKAMTNFFLKCPGFKHSIIYVIKLHHYLLVKKEGIPSLSSSFASFMREVAYTSGSDAFTLCFGAALAAE